MGQLLLILAVAFWTAAGLAGCGSTGSVREAVAARSDPGRQVYERSCQRCHPLYMPATFTAREWRFFVRKYGRKARLDAPSRDLVLRYLESHARR